MSEHISKKPATRKELLHLVTTAAEKEVSYKKKTKPTIAGTAKILGIHRDTLYEWMRDFAVRFSEIGQIGPTSQKTTQTSNGFTFLIGEALLGEGLEVAHIDLLIGDKDGPVGEAFANGLSNLSEGHTPLLAVIRPNLPPKPYTLLVPKVTVKNMEQVGKIFGPAQAAVAKAVADSVEEQILPREKIEDWVVVCSVFINPNAKDYRRIYQYNYGATKLALKRAMTNYPSWDKIVYDKDRAKHPIMGFRVPRLWRPPYLQIALDAPNLENAKTVIRQIPKSDRIILEVGTPLIKRFGVKAISDLRETARDMFIIADLKTLDVGKVEVDMAFEETADAVVASGLAATEVLDGFIHEAKRLGIYSIVDMMEVFSPVKKLLSLKQLPDIVIIHRAIDTEKAGVCSRIDLIAELRRNPDFERLLIAVAGGITPETAREALACGANIIIVGRYITQSKDVEHSVRDFLECTPEMHEDIDLYRVHVE